MPSARTGLRITNNFLHDMGTGTWFACVLVVSVLGSHLEGASAEVSDALLESLGAVFALALIALAVITITGVFRLYYWRAMTPASERGVKRRLLIAKHVAFLLVYGGGTVWMYLQTSA